MELAQARKIAEELKARLERSCHRITIAGSIRRRKPFPGDIELLAIPKFVDGVDQLDHEVGYLVAQGVLDLQIKRLVGKWMRNTYAALNDKLAEQRMAAMRIQLQSADKTPRIERMYDENKKYEGMQFWQGLEDEIEVRIEVINATTELIEL